MKDNEKRIDEQEKLLDHIIEYGGRQYIADEVKKYEEMPEMELSDEFNDRMDKMFKNAYKKEVKKERIQTGKKAAAVSIIVLGIAATTAMNVRAFREPVLNFIFGGSNHKNQTKVSPTSKTNEKKFNFEYIPEGYTLKKEQYLYDGTQIIYDYKNKQNSYLHIKIQLDQKYDNYVNQSNSDKYEKLKYNNHTYHILEAKQNTLLFYKNNTIFSIISKESSTTMIKIAENIKLK